MTYDLADNIDINYILKFIDDRTESNEDKFIAMVKKLNKLSESLCGILEAIISELIKDYCEIKEEEST